MKPFIKWVGGKTQLLEEINKRIDTSKKFYYEPFVGGGSSFLNALENYNFQEYHINDINGNLINVYQRLKDSFPFLYLELSKINSEFERLSSEKEKALYYYERRSEYNIGINNRDPRNAALFIFLNKTCFNGLYRTNLKGEFNVAFGKYENFSFDIFNLKEIHNAMNEKKVFIHNKQFYDLDIKEDSFVYMDPPYRPVTKDGFVKYNNEPFTEENQIQLSEYCKYLSDKNCKVLVSDSFTRDDFYEKYYEGFEIEKVFANRRINCDAKKRGKILEIMIHN